MTGAFDAIDFRGMDNHRLLDEWKDGPKTYLGLTVKHFPNMFMSIGPHQAYGNIPRSIEFAVGWISDCIKHCRDHDIGFIEATDQGVSFFSMILNNSWLTDNRYRIGPTISMILERIFSVTKLTPG